ncbi:MAG: glutaredoxin family protein [Coriobacteriia bacterium]
MTASKKRSRRVRLFTTPVCGYCRIAKAYMVDNGIDFVEIDITKDRRGRREMIVMTGQHGVPVILIGEKCLVGWSEAEFRRMYNA